MMGYCVSTYTILAWRYDVKIYTLLALHLHRDIFTLPSHAVRPHSRLAQSWIYAPPTVLVPP